MSLRSVAEALYRLEQEVSGLEKKVQTAPPRLKEELEDALRRLTSERDRLRRVLAAKKEPPLYRRPK